MVFNTKFSFVITIPKVDPISPIDPMYALLRYSNNMKWHVGITVEDVVLLIMSLQQIELICNINTCARQGGSSLPVSAHARTLNQQPPPPNRLPNFVPFPTFVFNSLLRNATFNQKRTTLASFRARALAHAPIGLIFCCLTLYPF